MVWVLSLYITTGHLVEKSCFKSFYSLVLHSVLNYSTGFFKQSGKYEIASEKIKTKEMGNYKIINIGTDKMVLYYGGYMKFTKGKCKMGQIG